MSKPYIIPKKGDRMIYLCQTYDDNHKSQIICVKDSLTGGQEWSRNRTKMIAKAIKLKSKYFLARPRSKESSKLYSKYYDFREKHKLYHEEQTHSPFVWSIVLEK